MQSLSWAANWFAASQEIPRISRNLKVHYRTHKPTPPVSIPGPPNPVHIPTSHLLEIHPNIIHPSTPRSPQWSLFLRFPHQDGCNSYVLYMSLSTTSDYCLNIIRQLVFLMARKSVACEVRTAFLNYDSDKFNYLKIWPCSDPCLIPGQSSWVL